VKFDRIGDGKYENIWLCGPAEKVFEGTVEIE
jgi:diaminopimelate epimerase